MFGRTIMLLNYNIIISDIDIIPFIDPNIFKLPKNEKRKKRKDKNKYDIDYDRYN
jgi:hypothetical protein